MSPKEEYTKLLRTLESSDLFLKLCEVGRKIGKLVYISERQIHPPDPEEEVGKYITTGEASGENHILLAWQKHVKNSDSKWPCQNFKVGYNAGFDQCLEDLREYIDFLNDVIYKSDIEIEDLLDYLYKGGIPLVQKTSFGKKAYLIS